MRPLLRSAYGWITGCAILLLAVSGCSDNLTDPESPQFARKKPNPSGEFTVTNFTVKQLDSLKPAEAAEALKAAECPDKHQICNKLILEYTGKVDALSFQVGIDWDRLYDRVDVEGAWRAALPALSGATETLYPDPNDPSPIIAYWQGQIRPVIHFNCFYAEYDCSPYGPPEFVVDRGIIALDHGPAGRPEGQRRGRPRSDRGRALIAHADQRDGVGRRHSHSSAPFFHS